MTLDDTHDTARRSWAPGAQRGDFPLTNLPLGVFSPPDGVARPGIAIGAWVLDLPAAGLLPPGATLNAFLAEGAGARRDLRAAAWRLLEAGAPMRPELLHPMAECVLHLPCAVGDYTDFFAGIHHAANTGRMLRPDQPLPPNYKHVPIAYHGRASSVRASGADVRRPSGQRKPAREAAPSFGPSRNLDYELELGIWIGPGNKPGQPIPIGQAAEHIAGYCLLNDWSARDIQAWESQPLGPFLAKSFCTTVSPWIVTPEALAPYRAPAMERDASPMAYLADVADQAVGAIDLALSAALNGHVVSRGTSRDLYWTAAQMVAHHTCGGCDLRPGDLFGSGTVSGAPAGSEGCLLEMTQGGRRPVRLADGTERRFLEDGDEVSLSASFGREGSGGGFGACVGRVVA